MTEKPVFFLDSSIYGRNVSFRELRLRVGRAHTLFFVSRPERKVDDLEVKINPYLPFATDLNQRTIDLTHADNRQRYVLSVESKHCSFSFTYLLVPLKKRETKDFIGEYYSVKQKRHRLVLLPDGTGWISFGSIFALKENLKILSYSFHPKKREREVLFPASVNGDGDRVTYFSSFRYDQEKEGFLVFLKRSIERNGGGYAEEENLLGHYPVRELFRKV